MHNNMANINILSAHAEVVFTTIENQRYMIRILILLLYLVL